MGLGRALKECRCRAGFTQEMLAARSGVSAEVIGTLEDGAQPENVEMLRRIAEAADCRLVDLIGLGRESDSRSEDDSFSSSHTASRTDSVSSHTPADVAEALNKETITLSRAGELLGMKPDEVPDALAAYEL